MHGVGTVARVLNVKPNLHENRLRNLAVDLNIFNQQDTLAAEVRRGKFVVLSFCLVASAYRPRKCMFQVGHKQRLRAKSRDARSFSFLLNVGIIVSRQNYHGRSITYDASNLADGLNAVLIGHKPIDDIRAERVVIKCTSCAENSFSRRSRPLRTHTHLLKHRRHGFAGIEVVVDNQRAKIFQLLNRNLLDVLLEFQIKRDGKFTALILFALNVNVAAHKLNHLFGNRHAQPRTLNTALSRSLFTFKGVEHVL